nr:WUSCHEL-related homeobox 11A [Dioscorea oppositifolia]
MDSHSQEHSSNSSSHGSNQQDRIPTEPVRSRWTPKPEQILILESIFNSGMVNPPKDETVRIRKLLEKFGAVGDANVFYWFQNRRSRSRRRQRQIQAGLAAAAAADPRTAGLPRATSAGSPMYHESASSSRSSTSSSSSSGGAFLPCSSTTTTSSSSLIGDDGADDLFSISRQMGFMDSNQNPMFYPSDVSQLHYQSGPITVFINGMPSEVPRGPIDLRAMFGQDVMLVHSSGELVPVNDYGVVYQGLQMGESYYLVSRTT